MKKNSFKSAFSELYLISPVVYKAVLENIKKSGGGGLQELEKLNKNFLMEEGKPVLEQAQIQAPGSTSIGTQQSADTVSVENDSQTTPIVDGFSQATQTTQDQNTQMTQTDINQNAQTTQTMPLNTSSISSQTTPNPEIFSKAIQTTQPSYATNFSQTTPNVQNFSKEIQTTQPSYVTNTTQTTPDVQKFSQATTLPPTPPTPPTPQIAPVAVQQENKQIANASMQESINDSKKSYQCDYCATKFTRLFSKQRHTRNIHGNAENRSTRKRMAVNSALPKKELKIKKTTSALKSRIPRPVNGVIALAKNKNAVKRSITQGESKIPRLIKRKIFKDKTMQKNENSKLKRKRIAEPADSEIPVKKNRLSRGIKRKTNDELKNSAKKRKVFENW